MWWEARTDEEAQLLELLPRIEELFLAAREAQVVMGYGSYFGLGGLRPLVVFDISILELEPVVPVVVTSDFLPERMRSLVQDLDLPSTTVFMGVSPPEPLSTAGLVSVSSGDVIRCTKTGEQGTVGPAVAVTDDRNGKFEGFLTAGHVTPNGVGAPVERLQHRRFRSPVTNNVGQVVLHSDPIDKPGSPGFDVSVVELSPGVSQSRIPSAGIARLNGPLNTPILCTMYGGFSGVVHNTAIVGALNAFGAGKRIWSKSWLLMPSGAAVQGDSGSLTVINSSQKAVGVLVGGSRVKNSPLFLCWYVHDIDALEQEVLSPQGYTIA